MIITTRKRSLGKGNIFSSLCQEFCTQWGSASVHAGIQPPRTRHPPGADTLPDQTPPRPDPLGPGTPPQTRYPPNQAPLDLAPPRSGTPQTRHPPPGAVYAGRYGQQAGCMHPTGMQSSLIMYLMFANKWLQLRLSAEVHEQICRYSNCSVSCILNYCQLIPWH